MSQLPSWEKLRGEGEGGKKKDKEKVAMLFPFCFSTYICKRDTRWCFDGNVSRHLKDECHAARIGDNTVTNQCVDQRQEVLIA